MLRIGTPGKDAKISSIGLRDDPPHYTMEYELQNGGGPKDAAKRLICFGIVCHGRSFRRDQKHLFAETAVILPAHLPKIP